MYTNISYISLNNMYALLCSAEPDSAVIGHTHIQETGSPGRSGMTTFTNYSSV